jgi:hypothetical protein
MRRGFKSQAERLALQHRTAFGIAPTDRLNPISFLRARGLIVWNPKDIPGIDPHHLQQLMVAGKDEWDGMTIKENGQIAIIINSSDAETRQANTLMHEWAHIELRHKPNRADRSEGGILLLSDYPAGIEEEADWLSGCMLAPRDGLLAHCRSGLNTTQIAAHYGISPQLANWRIRMTGIHRQLDR